MTEQIPSHYSGSAVLEGFNNLRKKFRNSFSSSTEVSPM